MALTLRVPALGESIREATLGAWKRAEGDEVAADEPLVEVESEKATLEVPSPGAGVLRKILRKSGETVAVGDVIAEIDQIGTSASTSTSRPCVHVCVRLNHWTPPQQLFFDDDVLDNSD